MYEVGSGDYAFVDWQIASSRASSTWYLFCGGNVGLKVNINAPGGLETPPTGIIGESSCPGFLFFNV